jgi:hypothetical protein
MKTRRALILCALLTVSVGGALAGCSASTSTTGGTTGGQPTATAAATAKPKPAAAPVISLQTCQTLMSLAEANQIMHAQPPATSVVASPGDGISSGSACHYLISPGVSVLNMFFVTYTGPTPITQQDLADSVKQLADDPGVTITSATMVTGVADQAAYLSFTESSNGHTVTGSVFWVLDGKLLFNCYTVVLDSSTPAGTQSNLQQCATQVVSRL